MNVVCLLLVLAATKAHADACDEAGHRLADEVGDAYALRTGPIMPVRRGRQSFHHTIAYTGDRPTMVSGRAGDGFSAKMAGSNTYSCGQPSSLSTSRKTWC